MMSSMSEVLALQKQQLQTYWHESGCIVALAKKRSQQIWAMNDVPSTYFGSKPNKQRSPLPTGTAVAQGMSASTT
jgi:hypothetical protein